MSLQTSLYMNTSLAASRQKVFAIVTVLANVCASSVCSKSSTARFAFCNDSVYVATSSSDFTSYLWHYFGEDKTVLTVNSVLSDQ